MTAYTSRVLYHMVGWGHPLEHERNFDVLCAILRTMEVRSCSVDGKSHGMIVRIDPDRPLTKGEPIEQNVSCYCDIPAASLSLHASKYGVFGVGLDRAVVAGWGGRPVIYIPKAPREPTSMVNTFTKDAMQVMWDLNKHFPGEEGTTTRSRVAGSPATSPEEAVDLAESLIRRDFLAFLKVFNVDLPDDHPENYYMEREWRKFGHMNLAMSLRCVVAPQEYHDRLRELVDSAHSRGFWLSTPVEYISVPTPIP
jgi:hypothetical protein